MQSENICCSVIMPTFNEVACIQSVVAGWLGEMRQVLGEGFSLIVVDDGSSDGTGAVLDTLAATEGRIVVIHQRNQGHGAALLTGYRRALEGNADYVFQVDSDDEFSSNDFRKLWAARDSSGFILGRRDRDRGALGRSVISTILSVWILLLYGRWIPDSNIPFRLMRGNILEGLLRRIPSRVFAPNIFLAIEAALQGEKSMNIPVTYVPRRTGRGKLIGGRLLRACFRTFFDLVRFRFADARLSALPASDQGISGRA